MKSEFWTPVLFGLLLLPSAARGDLIHHWEFEGEYLDTAGGVDGTPFGAAAFTSDARVGDQALQVNGNGDHVEMPDAASMQFGPVDSYSLTAWVKPAAGTSGWRGVVNKGRDIPPWYGIWINPDNQWTYGTEPNNLAGPQVTFDEWTHVAIVQDGAAGTRELYINGTLEASEIARDAINPGNLWMGGAASVAEWFTGNIDDVRIYDEALDATGVLLAAIGGEAVAIITRDIQDGFFGGDLIEVALDVDVLEPITTLEIREVIPRGFFASNPRNGGTIEEDSPAPGRQTVVWTLNDLAGQDFISLFYDIQVPLPYPASAFNRSSATADGEPVLILGDRVFPGGFDYVTQSLHILLKQPSWMANPPGTCDCNPPWSATPGLAGIRQDYLTDGDALGEQAIVPAPNEEVFPDYSGASPSPGPLTATSGTWLPTPRGGGGMEKWFELNTGDPQNVMAYVAFYIVNPLNAPLTAIIGSASDDSQQILIDGKEVWINNVCRGSASSNILDFSPPVDISPGKHLVLQKVFEGCGGFDCAMIFLDDENNPLPLEFSIDPVGYSTSKAFVLRDIPDIGPGETGTVSLKLRVKEPVDGAVIEENVPAGLVISSITDGGVLAGQQITWTIQGELERHDYTYSIEVPGSAVDGAFDGTVTLEGEVFPILGESAFTGGILTADGFIKHWLVLGPLDTSGLWLGDLVNPPANAIDGPSATPENGDIRLDWLTDGIITEANIRPFNGMRVATIFMGPAGDGITSSKANGLDFLNRPCAPEEPTWEKFVTTTTTFNNNDYFGEDIDTHTTYAACYIQVPREITTNVAFHSDDAFIVYLDGTEVAAYEPPPCSGDPLVGCGRAYGAEGAIADTAPIVIEEGEHFLLTRVHDGYGGSGHRLRFQDDGGNPLLPPDLQVRLHPVENPPEVYLRRILSSRTFRRGQPVLVTLRAEVEGSHDIGIKEVLPLDWTADPGSITDGGVLNGDRIEWTLTGVVGIKEIAYELVPAIPCPGGGRFCGNGPLGSEYTVDGSTTHSLKGDEALDRDRSPSDDDVAPWDSRDIGPRGGGVELIDIDGLDVELVGRGGGFIRTNDEFRFLSRPAAGDFEISAKIECLEDPGGSGEAGLHGRNSFDPGAAQITLGLAGSPGGTWQLQGTYRDEDGRNARPYTITQGRDVDQLPIWLRMSRTSDTILLERSDDGANWTEITTREVLGDRVQLTADLLVGLAVTGGGLGTTGALFREANCSLCGEGVPAPVNLTAVGGPGKVILTWESPRGNIQPEAYVILRDGSDLTEVDASRTAYEDTGLDPDTQYCYTVKSRVAEELSGNSNEACATTDEKAGEVFKRGDADGNGSVELTDVIRALTWQFVGGVEINCQDAADIDDDGAITLTDAIRSLNYQFVGVAGTIPDPPGPIQCGPDANEDGLPPCVYPEGSCNQSSQ